MTQPEAGTAKNAAYQRIYAMVDSIPKGCVGTYGQIAKEAGLPRRARLVGYALRQLPAGSKVPWHRVVNSRGEISVRGDGGSMRKQKRRLREEGVSVNRRGRVDLGVFGWRPEW